MLMNRKSVCCKSNALSAILFSVVTLSIFNDAVSGLTCPPCSKLHCSPKRASRLQCKGGVTTGICGCCPQCAKIENEYCGGEHNHRGTCDTDLNLECVRSEHGVYISKFHRLRKDPVGVCKKVKKNKKSHGRQSDAAFIQKCRPKCTARFCRKHPRAICSASDAAEAHMDCLGKCQHTSCRACALVTEPPCRSCKRDDIRCLKKFGKCIERHNCASRKRTCKWYKRPKKDIEGKLVCKMPSCS